MSNQKNPQNVTQHFDNKHTDDLIDHYWGSINYVAGMIKSSEIKAGLILSFYGILMNLIFQSLSRVMGTIGHDVVFYALGSIWFVLTAISIFYSIRCFMPQIESKYEDNIFFFGDVISKFGDIKNFTKIFHEISVDETRLFDQLGQQVYINSKIASAKFKNVNRSLQFLAVSLLVFLTTIVYYGAIQS